MRAVQQVASGDTRREAEIIADPRTGPGLASGQTLVDDHGGETLGRAVHGRGQARRARPDDRQVPSPRLGFGRESELGGDPVEARIEHHRAAGEHDHGPHARVHPGRLEDPLGIDRLLRVEAERQAHARQELAQRVSPRLPLLADHLHDILLRRLGGLPVRKQLRDRQIQPPLPHYPRHEDVPLRVSGPHDRDSGVNFAPLPSRYEQDPSRVRVEIAHRGAESVAPARGVVGTEHGRDPPAVRGVPLQ